MLTIVSVFSQSKATTGAHKRHIGLLNELAERQHDIYLFSPVNLLNKKGNHIKIQMPHKGRIPHSIQTFFSVRKAFKRLKDYSNAAESIIVFGFGNIFASLYLKRKMGIPVVFAVRSDMYASRKISLFRATGESQEALNRLKTSCYLSIFSSVERYVYRKSDIIIVQNSEEYEKLAERYGIDRGKIKIIGNNINFRKSETPTFTNSSSHLQSIVFVGSLIERKGIMLLLYAVKKLYEDGISLQLNILGEGPKYDEVQKFIQLYRLNNVVNMHGYVDNSLKYIADSDLLVMPSLYDSFPNTVLEALYVGTPVIGSDIGGISEILKYKSLLFEASTSENITKKIKKLLNAENYKKCRQLCEERRKAFIFDWTGRFEEILSKIA